MCLNILDYLETGNHFEITKLWTKAEFNVTTTTNHPSYTTLNLQGANSYPYTFLFSQMIRVVSNSYLIQLKQAQPEVPQTKIQDKLD